MLQAAEDRLPAELRKAVETKQAELAEQDPLGPWLAALRGGDPAAGRKLFFGKTELSCVRCHKVDRSGGEVGPDLTSIGKQPDRRYLLESICLPNARIAEGFETAVIADASGQVVTGVVKTENDEEVVLIQADGEQVPVFKDEIVARKKGQSSMPADLVEQMTQRELRDWVAYLATLKRGRDADVVE